MVVTLHQKVVEVTEDYLGPTARRFIDRQIEFHLGKRPEALNDADMVVLVEWVKVSLALLTDDQEMVEECSSKLMVLKLVVS